MKLQVFVDYACPFCYVGYETLKKVLRENNISVEIEHIFMEIHPETPEFGGSMLNIVSQKRKDIINEEVSRRGAAVDINPSITENLSNSRKATIIRCFIEKKHPDILNEYDKAVFDTYLVEHLDIGSKEFLAKILSSLDINVSVDQALNDTEANIKFELDQMKVRENYVSEVPAYISGWKRCVGAVSVEELEMFIRNL